MKFILSLLIGIGGIGVLAQPVFASAFGVHKNTSLSKPIFHKRNSYFIDLEVPTNQVWVGCTRSFPPEADSWLEVWVLGDEVPYEFMYRRILNAKICLKEEREFHKIIQDAKSLRVVGILPDESSHQGYPPEPRVPKRFTASSNYISLIFIRLQAENRCKAWSSADCLPENYWAGMTPSP